MFQFSENNLDHNAVLKSNLIFQGSSDAGNKTRNSKYAKNKYNWCVFVIIEYICFVFDVCAIYNSYKYVFLQSTSECLKLKIYWNLRTKFGHRKIQTFEKIQTVEAWSVITCDIARSQRNISRMGVVRVQKSFQVILHQILIWKLRLSVEFTRHLIHVCKWSGEFSFSDVTSRRKLY